MELEFVFDSGDTFKLGRLSPGDETSFRKHGNEYGKKFSRFETGHPNEDLLDYIRPIDIRMTFLKHTAKTLFGDEGTTGVYTILQRNTGKKVDLYWRERSTLYQGIITNFSYSDLNTGDFDIEIEFLSVNVIEGID